MPMNIVGYERQQVRLEGAAVEAANAEGQIVKEGTTVTSGTKRGSADARGSKSIALEAQAIEVANTANKTAKQEKGAPRLDFISVSDAQQSHRDAPRV